MNIALLIIFGFLLLSLFLGIQARRGKDMSIEQWSVGGRGFGTLFVFMLLAGEIYTTSTLLGTSGWAYAKGNGALYILAVSPLSYLPGYFLLPRIWKYAKQHNLISQSDFFVSKYKNNYIGILVAIVGVMAIIPYLVIQFKGLGIIVSEASYGSISPTVAIWLGVLALIIYVMTSGVHGTAWTAVIKDIMIFLVVVSLGLYLPFHYYGGIQPMFEAVSAAKPGYFTFPDKGLSASWYISTVLITVAGFYTWPHTFGSILTAKNDNVFRKNTIIMPLYTLMLVFVLFVGYTAILQVPGLTGAAGDLALLRLSLKTFDPWIVGLIGAAGLLTALVPGSMLLMSASTMLAKNVYRVIVPSTSDQHLAKVAKLFVPLLALISLYFTLSGNSTILTLLLMGYALVTQLLPALLASLFKNNFVTTKGAMAGIICGVTTVMYITVAKTTFGSIFPAAPQFIQDLNNGFIALFVNLVASALVSYATRTSVITLKETEKIKSA